MLKTYTRAGALVCLVAMIVVAAAGLYQKFQQNPGQTALAGLVVVGIITLSVLFGKKRKS